MTKNILKNGFMGIKILATFEKVALVERVNMHDYVVVNNLTTSNDLTCSWAFAYGYFEDYKQALACFKEKTV